MARIFLGIKSALKTPVLMDLVKSRKISPHVLVLLSNSLWTFEGTGPSAEAIKKLAYSEFSKLCQKSLT
jgi:hypothetical protein